MELNLMATLFLPMIVALTGGVATALQRLLAGTMGQALGDLESVFITYCGGAVVVSLITIIYKGGINVTAWQQLPWYVYLAGPLGLVIVGSYSYTIPRIGIVTATILFVVSALVVGAVIDHFGLFGVAQRTLNISRALGMAVFLLGMWMVIR